MRAEEGEPGNEATLTYCIMFFLTAGGTVGKAGSRADEGRGDYQERAAADSGDETEGGSSVCGGVVCFNSVSPPPPPPPPPPPRHPGH